MGPGGTLWTLWTLCGWLQLAAAVALTATGSRGGVGPPASFEQASTVASPVGETAEAAEVVAGSGLEPVDYLRRFGYIKPDEEVAVDDKAMSGAIQNFQKFVDIYESGDLDEATTQKMQSARCALPDDVGLAASQPSRRFLNQEEVDRVFEEAFQAWAAATGSPQMKFVARRGDLSAGETAADIEIRFVRDAHPNCSLGPLPQPSSEQATLLGHAHGPPAAYIHLNDWVQWSTEPNNAAKAGVRSLMASALHQVGHALGLGHLGGSTASSMFPLDSQQQTKLAKADRKLASDLYGRLASSRQAGGFLQLERRRLPDMSHDWYNASEAQTMEECADFGRKKGIKLLVWERKRRACSVKTAGPARSRLQLYTGAGKRLDDWDLSGYELDTSELESDVSSWLGSRQCDLILRLDDWPQDAGKRRTSYVCKTFKEDDCCVMLLRAALRSQPELLARPN